ncbi:MAG: zf-HC2 domain-containing protein [Myxococcota bacterium]
MSETNEADRTLGNLLDLTRDDEVDCDQFSRHLAAFVEGGLEGPLRALMEHHRKICPECEEERAVLMRALGLEP